MVAAAEQYRGIAVREEDCRVLRHLRSSVTGTNAPVTTYYLVDGNNSTGYAQAIEQSATPGTPTLSYVRGVNLISQDNAAGTANAGTYYLVADGHEGGITGGGDVATQFFATDISAFQFGLGVAYGN